MNCQMFIYVNPAKHFQPRGTLQSLGSGTAPAILDSKHFRCEQKNEGFHREVCDEERSQIKIG